MVTGPTAEASELTAKVALLAGANQAIAVIEARPRCEGLVFADDGRWICIPGWIMTVVDQAGGTG
jgi:hypothetical protein